uniref:hypothetical protein n=1 Tax=Pseudonocardia lacus TaxID=2835865 RepID=UPI001BDC6EB0
MSNELTRCALAGCEELIEQSADGGPKRLYCSAAHRAAARKQRQVARTSGEETTAGVTAAAAAPAIGDRAPAAAPGDADPSDQDVSAGRPVGGSATG